ncbi:MAG TPA: endonuclease III [Anaerolineae bacterium]|nr:endonuclease III [Anaerolineae bacterium]
MESPETFALEVHRRLLKAYGQPVWRVRLPPVDELISTILSQNTNDLNRDRAFTSLREAFPTWEAVRDAKPEAVIEAIKIAGLSNLKGPRIQGILQQLTEELGEINLDFLHQLPPDEVRAWLLRFKGVGPKTAAIVMLFSLDMPAFPVDTHIYRVTGRLGLRSKEIDAEKAHTFLESLFPPETYYAAHLNLIRHGRQVCLARLPACDRCVLHDLCAYYREFVIETVAVESDG